MSVLAPAVTGCGGHSPLGEEQVFRRQAARLEPGEISVVEAAFTVGEVFRVLHRGTRAGVLPSMELDVTVGEAQWSPSIFASRKGPAFAQSL